MYQEENEKNIIIFLSIITIFILIGIIFIYSASSAYALEKLGSAHYFVKKQVIGCAIGLLGLIIFRFLPLKFIRSLIPFIFIILLCVTTLTTLDPIGTVIHGSRRWIYFFGISIQPSEFLKMSFITYISHIICKKKYKVHSLIRGYLPLLLIVGLTSLVLLKQPDFGQTITLCVTAFLLFFIAECQIKHILYTLSFSVPAIAFLILIKPYRLNRILTFLNPWNDPKGSGFQIIQSLIAIGSGNLSGLGLARSKQKFFYLPMQHTDFIFSIIAEETGFIGSLLLICLYIGFLYYGLKIADSLTDQFCYYTTLGFIILTSIQAIINFFVTTGLLPTKGLGLPFISYGNSSLIAHMCMIGLIINFVNNNKKKINELNYEISISV